MSAGVRRRRPRSLLSWVLASRLAGGKNALRDYLALVAFTSRALRHANFRRRAWRSALVATGLNIHLHDLRHTGNHLVAEAGANPRELMERMGHSTGRAALIYLHSTSARQHHLADAVTARAQSELGKTDQPSDGGVARMWHEAQGTTDSAS